MRLKQYYQMRGDLFDYKQPAYQFINYKEVEIRIKYLVETSGIGLLTGDHGVGKTYTVKKILEQYDNKNHNVIYISLSRLTRAMFISTVLKSFGEKSNRWGDIELVYIREILEKEYFLNRKKTILVLDGVELLSDDSLTAVMDMSNTMEDTKATLLLIGSGNLLSKLNMTMYKVLKNKININYHFQANQIEEMEEYIKNRLNEVDVSSSLIEVNALRIMSERSLGLVRELNDIMQRSLLFGMIKNKKIIDEEIVIDALKDKEF